VDGLRRVSHDHAAAGSISRRRVRVDAQARPKLAPENDNIVRTGDFGMTVSVRTLVSGAVWTIGAFGAGQALRVVTNIVLTRLLAPELFGIMVIINTLRSGVELLTDVGITQNIVYSKNADDPNFYNTAWTMRIIRSAVLCAILTIVAVPMARFYNIPTLAYALPLTGVTLLIMGFESVSLALLQKKMQFAAINIYQLSAGLITAVISIVYAYFNPTIWALIYGGILSAFVYLGGSFLLMPHLRHRLMIDKKSAGEIVGFGKWIFFSSMVFFLAGNIDRLYFGKVVPLKLLGIYGIARSIAELFTTVAARLGSSVVFPFIASHANTPRDVLRRELDPIRSRFLLLMALGCSLFISSADFAIRLIYDTRYQAATWMLPILIVGAWFSMLAALNESTILGLGRPSYNAYANGVRFALLVVALPYGFEVGGLVGSIVALTLVEACRYIPTYIGQRREGFAFGAKDLGITLLMFAMTALWEGARWSLGFGTSFDSLFTPI
jgi:O-antigen/teichoic acid export membrane protein